MDSPERCAEYRDVSCISPALEMMAANSDYRFVMENMLNLMEYLERHPDRRADILRYTREGRLEWGATFNQPYESLLSGEQLVRQTYFGRRWLRSALPGCDALVYFNPDVPGRALQMQQILSKSGVPYMVISRFHEGVYRWESPDGSSVVAYSPGHYGNSSAVLNAPPAAAVEAIERYLAKWSPYHAARGLPPEFPLLNSVDFSKPTDFGRVISLWNGRGDAAGPFPRLGYSSAREFFEALTRGAPRLDRVAGERPNLWLYIHGPTHHYAIAAQREAAVLLPAAEAFSVARALLEGGFDGYPAQALSEAWMASLYPDHGWGGKEGQITDRLFREKYEFARDEGARIASEAMVAIAGRVRTDPVRGVPVVVFNSLSWPRSGPVEATVPVPFGPWRLTDAAGAAIPVQTLPAMPDQASGLVRVVFVADEVPSLGYKTFYVSPGPAAPTGRPERREPSTVLENRFYRVELAPGGIKSVIDKDFGREILDTRAFLGFEVFTMKSVGNGAGEFGRVQQPTMEGFARLSGQAPDWARVAEETGPVRTVFLYRTALPNVAVEERVVLYEGLKRIDCEVALIGWDGLPYREFRLAVPAAGAGRVAYEVPMGVVEVGRSEAKGTGGPAYGSLVYDEEMSAIRPREVQNFLSVDGTDVGLTLTTSVAVNDFEDPTGAGPGPVLQPVLLASRRSCHGEGNWYLQEGDHRYRFSLTSHEPGWRNGRRRGIEANVPLFAVVDPRPGPAAALPPLLSFFEVTAPNAVISAVKKAEDDDAVVVRFYDIEGRAGEAGIASFRPVACAVRANMIEDEGAPLAVGKGRMRLPLGAWAIETVKLRFRSS
jgi:alpha-mannosidase